MKQNGPFPEFELFLGIDQTGAWDKTRKRPKALPLAMISKSGKSWRLSLHELPELTPSALASVGVDVKTVPALILLDCVFWPGGIRGSEGLWQDFRRAFHHSTLEETPGSKAAEDFFKMHAKTNHRRSGSLRKVDRLVRSQSLYSPTPFQRNVQCGTYRIWRELGSEPEPWVHLWPWDALGRATSHPIWIAEGYPSWIRRTQARTGLDPGACVLERGVRATLKKSRDFEDAALLACFGFQNPCPAEPEMTPEGWIYGVALPPKREIKSSAAARPEKKAPSSVFSRKASPIR